MGGADREGVEAVVCGPHGVGRDSGSRRTTLVAERDPVFARFPYLVTVPDGSTTSFRTMASTASSMASMT
jgi:hypothetical protein